MHDKFLHQKKNKEWGIVLISSFAFVLFSGLLSIIFYENLIKKGLFYMYFVGFSVFPILLCLIERYSGFLTKTGTLTISGWVVLGFNLLFFLKMAGSPSLNNLFSGMFWLIMASFILWILRPALFKHNHRAVSLGPRG